MRKDPFAVVLLDEFEKASPPIWDLFLQVFDDGRLTDLQGRVVDFRRCVIVLTSNLGAPLVRGPSVGFEPGERVFSSAGIERAIRTWFRPEFLNRLDRVVVFRPFERSAMRALLDKELAEALARRGLRGRPWAVEVDESAYAFLIDKGFSPELGARPLKRALERYLLAPLAAAIVEKAVPEGDQFLFVTAVDGERIDVVFVDPDAEPEAPEPHGGGRGARARRAGARPCGDGRQGHGAVPARRAAAHRRRRRRAPGAEGSRAVRHVRAGLLGARGPVLAARRDRVPRPARRPRPGPPSDWAHASSAACDRTGGRTTSSRGSSRVGCTSSIAR